MMDQNGILYELANCEVVRYDVDDEHYYYGGEKDKERIYYLSVTRVLDIGGPFPEGLRQWLRASSYEETQERLEFTATRGSKLHDALDKLMNAEEIDLRTYLTQFEKGAITTFTRMMRFLTPSNYETEMIVADPDLRIAGTLDFEGWVDEWKLEALLNPNKYLEIDSDDDFQLKEAWLELPSKMNKRQRIIIDWKFTGRNAYSHKVQVAAYKTMYNKSRKGTASRAFTWRYSPKHKAGFDFQESTLTYQSFKRIYDTCIEYLGEFPNPPMLKKYPDRVRLYQERKKNKHEQNQKRDLSASPPMAEQN